MPCLPFLCHLRLRSSASSLCIVFVSVASSRRVFFLTVQSMALKKRRPSVSSRNLELIRGIDKYSRSKMYHKRGLWAIKVKHDGVFLKYDPKPVEKASKYYPTDDVKKPLANYRKHKPTKLRASITPGIVLILSVDDSWGSSEFRFRLSKRFLNSQRYGSTSRVDGSCVRHLQHVMRDEK